MATSVQSILRKRKWSGKEIGKTLVAVTVQDLENKAYPGIDAKPPCSMDKVNAMIRTITTEQDCNDFYCYQAINDGLWGAYNLTKFTTQQFYHAFYRCSNALTSCQASEDALKKATDYPLLMTQGQYDRAKQKAAEDLKQKAESYASLMLYTVQHFFDNSSKAPYPIRAELIRSRNTIARNPRLLAEYNEAVGNGYYMFPDGVRSDNMSKEEWRKEINTRFIAQHPMTINGIPATEEEILDHGKSNVFYNVAKLVFNGTDGLKATYKEAFGEELNLTQEEAEAVLAYIETAAMSTKAFAEKEAKLIPQDFPLDPFINYVTGWAVGTAPVWHFRSEPPAYLTRDAFLEDIGTWYAGIHSFSPAEAKATFKEFKTDYPELYEAVKDYMESRIPRLKEIKPSLRVSQAIRWEELAEADYLNFKDRIEPKDEHILKAVASGDTLDNYEKTARILWNSIAIVQNPLPCQLDENGDYVEQGNKLLTGFGTLDSYMKLEEKGQPLRTLREDMLKPSLRFMYAYNALMGIIGEAYDIDGMEDYQLDLSGFESKVESFNHVLYLFHLDLYGNQAEIDRKRELTKKLFAPVDVEELKPTQEAIEKAKALAREIGFTETAQIQLKNFDRFFDVLEGKEA